MKKRVYVHTEEIEHIRDILRSEGDAFIDGMYSIFCPKQNTSWLCIEDCREWPDHNGEMKLLTPSEAARAEIQRHYPDLNLRARKRDFPLLDISAPIFYRGQYTGELYYLDLKGAYVQIYQHLWLDQCYPRATCTYPLWSIAQRLKPWKQARNSLIGLTRSHELYMVQGRKGYFQKYHNRYFNPHLWRQVQAILHAFAIYALQQNVLYISTDCYIFGNAVNFIKMEQLFRDLGFEVHRGHNDGQITGWGSYRIPGVKSTLRQAETHTKLNNINGDLQDLQWINYLAKSR